MELEMCGNFLLFLWMEDILTDAEYRRAEERFNKKIADRKTENSSEKPNNCETQTEGVWNAGFKTGYDKGYKDAQKVKDSQDLVKDLVKAFCEDGTWLERQGVYTLTLAEAKQRAVDIIESVTQTETQNSNLTFEKADERCKGCNHYKLTCDLFSEICKYEPKDEPQTDAYDSAKFSHNCIGMCENPKMHMAKVTDEPQTEYKKWETKPKADKPTEITTCVGVAMALIEDEPQTEGNDE